MLKFIKWLRSYFPHEEEFDFDSEFAKLIKATPMTEVLSRADQEAKWPVRSSPSQRLTALRGARPDPFAPKVSKPKAPKRVANARPAAKSSAHKSRL